MGYETFKVLVIDDDPLVRQLYLTGLSRHHYDVIEAKSGEEGLLRAFQERPDAVLVDIMMPKLDGFAVCKLLRSMPCTAGVPILILTVLDGLDARRKAEQVGADDFVTKGDPLETLDGRIKMHLKRSFLARAQSWLEDLDGSAALERALRERLATGLPTAVCYLDLNGLDACNEKAGYEAGDRVLWILGRVLRERANKQNIGEYIGHCGQDNFMILTGVEEAETISRGVLSAFEGAMVKRSGFSLSNGHTPGLSVAIVYVGGERAIHPAEVWRAGQRLLHEMQAEPGSGMRTVRV